MLFLYCRCWELIYEFYLHFVYCACMWVFESHLLLTLFLQSIVNVRWPQIASSRSSKEKDRKKAWWKYYKIWHNSNANLDEKNNKKSSSHMYIKINIISKCTSIIKDSLFISYIFFACLSKINEKKFFLDLY